MVGELGVVQRGLEGSAAISRVGAQTGEPCGYVEPGFSYAREKDLIFTRKERGGGTRGHI